MAAKAQAAPVQDFGFDFSATDKTANQVPVAPKDDAEDTNDPQDFMPDENGDDDIVVDESEGGISPMDVRASTLSMHRKNDSN